MNLGTCCFEGFATKMKLVSYNRIDGKPTRTIEETEQYFTLTRDGRIWFSGYWDLELTNEKDDTYKYRGLMPASDKVLSDMSDWLRNMLQTDTILAFDGEARFALSLNPEEKIFVGVKSIIDPNEEPYWFFYEGNNINIGDRFLAPFRNGQRYYNVEVVDIIVAKPENGPVPLRQQKRMMTLEDSMRSQLPNEFTNMFKKMNGWDVDNT